MSTATYNCQKVTNIDALRNLSPYATDGVVLLLGTLTEGDGGGGLFYWKDSKVAADDGASYISVFGISTGQWYRAPVAATFTSAVSSTGTVTGKGLISTLGTITTQLANVAGTATWNAGGVDFVANTLTVGNTASGAGSLLAEWKVTGTGAGTMFSVSKAGLLATKAVSVAQGSIATQVAANAVSVTWNDLGVPATFKANTMTVIDTSSAVGSLLAEWTVGGATMFSVSKAGTVTAPAVTASGAVTGATLVGTLSPARTVAAYAAFWNPIAIEQITLLAATDIASGNSNPLVVPAYPRTLSVKVTEGGVAVTAGTMTVSGLDQNGQAVSEAFSLISAGSPLLVGTKCFSRITTPSGIVMAGVVGGGAGTTVSIGVGNGLGLTGHPGGTYALVKNNVAHASATAGTVSATNGTFTPDGANLPDAAKDFEVWYTYSID
jgi:hypothetical protein